MSLATVRSSVQALHDTIDELQETIRQLREQLVPTFVFPARWRLTRKERQTLSFLLARSPQICSQDSIMNALYAIDPDDPPVGKIVGVYLCKLRKKLAPEHIAIETNWGDGYRIPFESAQRLHWICRAETFSAVTVVAAPSEHGRIVSIEGDYSSPTHLERAIAAMRAAGEKAWSQPPIVRRAQ